MEANDGIDGDDHLIKHSSQQPNVEDRHRTFEFKSEQTALERSASGRKRILKNKDITKRVRDAGVCDYHGVLKTRCNPECFLRGADDGSTISALRVKKKTTQKATEALLKYRRSRLHARKTSNVERKNIGREIAQFSLLPKAEDTNAEIDLDMLPASLASPALASGVEHFMRKIEGNSSSMRSDRNTQDSNAPQEPSGWASVQHGFGLPSPAEATQGWSAINSYTSPIDLYATQPHHMGVSGPSMWMTGILQAPTIVLQEYEFPNFPWTGNFEGFESPLPPAIETPLHYNVDRSSEYIEAPGRMRLGDYASTAPPCTGYRSISNLEYRDQHRYTQSIGGRCGQSEGNTYLWDPISDPTFIDGLDSFRTTTLEMSDAVSGAQHGTHEACINPELHRSGAFTARSGSFSVTPYSMPLEACEETSGYDM